MIQTTITPAAPDQNTETPPDFPERIQTAITPAADPRQAVWIDDAARIRGYRQDDPRRMIQTAIRTAAPDQERRNAVRSSETASGSMTLPDLQ